MNVRVVVLQSKKQVAHYAINKRDNLDIIIPIGPEAMFETEKYALDVYNVGELWSGTDYEQAKNESEARINALIEMLNTYSYNWNPNIALEMGHYYGFQLWVIIGQIHYNYFIAQSIVKHFLPTKVLIYTNCDLKNFMQIRPSPDSIFAEVFLNSGCIENELIEIVSISEKMVKSNINQKILSVLPVSLTNKLRQIRNKWRVRRFRKFKYRLLLVGGGYDWFKVSRHEVFRKNFGIDISLTQPINKRIEPSDELTSILNSSVEYVGATVYGMKDLASAIQSDLVFYLKKHKKLISSLKRYDSVISGVFTFPWENHLAHLANMAGIPVVLWQHGEKGQASSVTSLYTELYYATDYLAYGPEVVRQYQSWVGKNSLKNTLAVGSIGKKIVWKGGDRIVYSTGKWFKTATPFQSIPDPDARLYNAQKVILGYFDNLAGNPNVVLNANNTSGFNAIPHKYGNIDIDYITPFINLLETAKIIVLDTPATTLVEACSTKVPIFVLGGRVNYHPLFLEKIKRRVVWCEDPNDLVAKIDLYLHTGLYEADVNDNIYYREYCGIEDATSVASQASKSLIDAIER